MTVVRATQHLICETWPQRGDPNIKPHDAWERGLELDVSHAPHGEARVPGHDEARYDPVTETVLFRRVHTLTTCYSVREEHITNDHGRAVREAVEAQYGPIKEADS